MGGRRFLAGLAVVLVAGAGAGGGAEAQEPPRQRQPDQAHVQEALNAGLTARMTARLEAEALRLGRSARASALSAPANPEELDVVVEGDDRAALVQAVERVGGRVERPLTGAVGAVVDRDRLAELGHSPGVTRAWIDQAPIPDDISEGTRPTTEFAGATNASLWHGGVPPQRGAGVNIGIIDVGFSGFNGLPIPSDRPPAARVFSNNQCPTDMFGPAVSNHGSAVTEIVYDMAPDATFYLVCIDQESDLELALAFLAANNVSIVNMSLSFTDGRGDGSSWSPLHAAAIVRRARLDHQMLWLNSAGNRGQSHYMVSAGDADNDEFVEIFPGRPFAGDQNEFFLFAVAPGETVSLDVRWDSWFGAIRDYDLLVFDASTGDFVTESIFDQTGGVFPPWENVQVANSSGAVATYALAVFRFSAPTTPVRFDIFGFGAVALELNDPAQSITEPSTSPYAMAVGAHCFRGTATEPFSSRGPTIDGRIKPDISGPDAVSTMTFGSAAATCDGSSGFFGTSASAPHAAGAAAVLKGVNPLPDVLDAAELQALLEAYANGTVALDPQGQDSNRGFGALTLPGTPGTPIPPNGELYTGINPPVRIMDTRPGPGCVGGSCVPLGSAQTRNLAIHSRPEVPDDASAVVLNVTAIGPTSTSHLTVFPTGQPVPRVANLNYTAGQIVGNHVTATIGSGGQISLFNAGGQVHLTVDLAGFYSPTAGTVGLVPMNPPGRIMDTRPASCVGPFCTRIGPAMTVELPVHNVNAGGTVIPDTVTAVVLNVTGVLPTSTTHITIWPEGPTPNVASLNLSTGIVRGNLVVATVGSDGAIRLRNAGGQVDLVADVLGWYESGGDAYVALSPRRTLDTRTGNGPRFGSLTAGEQYDHQVQNIYSVPDEATAALLNVTVVAPSGAGHLTIFPDGAPMVPRTANVNFRAGQVVPNAVISGLGEPSGRITIFNNPTSSATPVVADLAGYFIP
jgi:Subtilase family